MWNRIKRFFLDSETIFWARLQLGIGAVWEILVQSDLTPILGAKWMPYWLIASGVVTEILRRRRAPELGKDA